MRLIRYVILTFINPYPGLELGEDDLHEVKRPKRLPLFDMSIQTFDLKVPICKLVCGGMHTVAIAPSGAVFTWGCNDEGALGRPGVEDKPIVVGLNMRCTDASAGDSHTVFYNTELNRACFTGLYRVSVNIFSP
jgi:regulator of chromosome condensation